MAENYTRDNKPLFQRMVLINKFIDNNIIIGLNEKG